MKYLNKLINNNTGVSSKNFLVVTITIVSLVLLLIPAIILLVEIIYNHTILTDLSGLSQYIGSVAALLATAGITKAWSEKYENKK